MSKAVLWSTHKQLTRLVHQFQQALDGVPDEDLTSWKPSAEQNGGGEMNTFAGLGIHTLHAAGWRIVHQVFGHDYPRDRESEFLATASRAELDQMFAELLDRFASLISSEPEIDLTTMPPTIREEPPDWTRMDYLVQVASHTALHVGHAQINKQIWQVERGNSLF